MDKSDTYQVRHVAGDVPSVRSLDLRVGIAGHYRSGPAYRCPARVLARDYVVIYTEAGRGEVRAGSQLALAHPGDAFLLVPGVEHEYGTRGKEWQLLWFHCDGSLPDSLFASGGARQWLPPTPCGADSSIPRLMRDILSELEQKQPYFDVMAQAYAQAALAELLRRRGGPTAERAGRDSDVLQRVSDYVLARLDQPISVVELAEMVHLSPRHFCRVFARLGGQSPQQYVLRLKMSEAKRLLASTNLTVAEVAAQVGLVDPYYFSRLFHRKTGQSPSEFRRQLSGAPGATSDAPTE